MSLSHAEMNGSFITGLHGTMIFTSSHYLYFVLHYKIMYFYLQGQFLQAQLNAWGIGGEMLLLRGDDNSGELLMLVQLISASR